MNVLLEGEQSLLPESAIVLQPFRGLEQRFGVEGQKMLSPADGSLQQSSALKDADGLGDGVQRDGELAGDIRDTRFRVLQPRQDRAACGIAQCEEGVVQAARSIFTQKGEYNGEP